MPELIAETFERAGELLSCYSNELLDQGFWLLLSGPSPQFMATRVDRNIALPARRRALRSFVPLFRQIMPVRCSAYLSASEDSGANPVNSSCYMWWDLLTDTLSLSPDPDDLDLARLEEDFLFTLGDILAINHDACRESALHGIGHWVKMFPRLATVVDEFLSTTSGLRPELIDYARRAKAGSVF